MHISAPGSLQVQLLLFALGRPPSCICNMHAHLSFCVILCARQVDMANHDSVAPSAQVRS